MQKKSFIYSWIFQVTLILLISACCALFYNIISGSNFNAFQKYDKVGTEKTLSSENISIKTPQGIDLDSLYYLVANEMAIVIDCRSIEKYRMGHIPGAIHFGADVSIKDISKQIKDTDGKPIVFYGNRTEFANIQAIVDSLASEEVSGLHIFKGGFSEWEKRSYELEK